MPEYLEKTEVLDILLQVPQQVLQQALKLLQQLLAASMILHFTSLQHGLAFG
jgi:hypothetical protein